MPLISSRDSCSLSPQVLIRTNEASLKSETVRLENSSPLLSLFLTRIENRSSMEQQMDRQTLSTPRSSDNKKRKLPCEHTDLESPISKQKLQNEELMELEESSENNNRNLVSTSSSSSSSNEATISSSSLESSIEFDTGASVNNYAYDNCKKGLFKELEELHDPTINELVKISIQDERGGSKQPTIDQEFEQYFSKLML